MRISSWTDSLTIHFFLGSSTNPCLSDCWLWKKSEGVCVERPGSNCFDVTCAADKISGNFISKLFSDDMKIESDGNFSSHLATSFINFFIFKNFFFSESYQKHRQWKLDFQLSIWGMWNVRKLWRKFRNYWSFCVCQSRSWSIENRRTNVFH